MPPDAILLGKVEVSGVIEYKPQCVSASVIAVYGINRPLQEVIEEYYKALVISNWELSSTNIPNKTDSFAFYQKDTKVTVDITDEIALSLPSLKTSQFTTIYSVFTRYQDPSIAECTP